MQTDSKKDSKSEEKELKKLFEAHLTVLKNKLGRAPTMEELQSSMDKSDESEANPTPVASQAPSPGEPKQEVVSPQGTTTQEPLEKTGPKILHMKVYFGMSSDKDGKKKPDSNKVLFYENPVDGMYYSVNDETWSNEKPSILDHLNSRPIEYSEKDLVSAIANGVVGDEDFDSLEKAGMLTETPRKLWTLMKKLTSETQQLEEMGKSEEGEGDENAPIDLDVVPDGHSDTKIGTGENVLASYMDTAGVSSEAAAQAIDAVGVDAFAQIMTAAKEAALSGLEDSIRRVVREEIERILEEGASGDIPESEIEGQQEEQSEYAIQDQEL